MSLGHELPSRTTHPAKHHLLLFQVPPDNFISCTLILVWGRGNSCSLPSPCQYFIDLHHTITTAITFPGWGVCHQMKKGSAEPLAWLHGCSREGHHGSSLAVRANGSHLACCRGKKKRSCCLQCPDTCTQLRKRAFSAWEGWCMEHPKLLTGGFTVSASLTQCKVLF